MSYDFSVDKKTGIILITGYVLVGLLLFVAGFLLGINYGLSSKAAEILARSSAPGPLASSLQAAKSAENSLKNPSSLMNSAPTTLTPVTQAGLPTVQSAAVMPSSGAQGAATASPVASTAGQHSAIASDSAPAAAAPPVRAPATESQADLGASAPTPSPVLTPPGTGSGYSIQVGAFLDQINASRLAKDLQKKGYPAAVLNFSDSEYRVWHAVRFGQFKHLEAAARVARQFERSQQLVAIVRRADSL